MMRRLLGVLIALSGCAGSLPSSGPQGAQLRAGVITNPGPAAQAELEAVVSSILGVGNVTLAADALTNSSVLFVERGTLRDDQGERVNGRDLGRPDRFILQVSGADCVLMHPASGRRMTLRGVECRAER